MKKNLSLFIILATSVILIIAGCSNNHSNQFQSKHAYGLVLSSGTALRLEPFEFSGIITLVPGGQSIEIKGRSAEQSRVGKLKDYWYRVRVKQGYDGWIFGKFIKIISTDSNEKAGELAEKFIEQKTEKYRQDLEGKWWSINKFGDFTNHCLELYKDGVYTSYLKGSGKKFIGNFSFNHIKHKIIFKSGTSFKGNLRIVERGQDYILTRQMVDEELRFKKISIELGPEPVVPKKQEKTKEPKK